MRSLMVLAGLLGGLATVAATPSEPERVDSGTLEVLYRALESMRTKAGLATLERSESLERLAGERAQRLAFERMNNRMRHPVPLDDALDDDPELSGRKVTERVVVVPSTVERSERLHAAWDNPESGALAIDPKATAVGLGASLLGETLVFLALFEYGHPVTDREAFENAVLEQVNEVRLENGLAALVSDDALREVARAHSETMLAGGFMGHRSPDGSMPADRVRAAGIPFRLVGENVAHSLKSLGAVHGVIDEWMASPLHRHNILTPDYTQTAVGAAIAEDGTLYVTQLFSER